MTYRIFAVTLLAAACAAESTPGDPAEPTPDITETDSNATDTADAERPPPEHRPVAEACPAVAPADDAVCDPDPGPHDCGADADCGGPSGRCLRTYVFGRDTACRCATSECLTDADCGAGQVCSCGLASDDPAPCGGVVGEGPCLHRCVPATCQTDADCGGGALCSPSYDLCGVTVEGYHCHDPSADVCFSDAECGPNQLCRHDEDGWGCDDRPICD